jgi:hypothetical protein
MRLKNIGDFGRTVDYELWEEKLWRWHNDTLLSSSDDMITATTFNPGGQNPS